MGALAPFLDAHGALTTEGLIRSARNGDPVREAREKPPTARRPICQPGFPIATPTGIYGRTLGLPGGRRRRSTSPGAKRSSLKTRACPGPSDAAAGGLARASGGRSADLLWPLLDAGAAWPSAISTPTAIGCDTLPQRPTEEWRERPQMT